MKFPNTPLIILFLFILSAPSLSQNIILPEATYRIAFYNIENFFDPYVDSTNTYNEFVADGEKHWTWSRYNDKRKKIYKVITALGEGRQVTIAAFAEIENSFVLEDLIRETPLNALGYQVIHFDSEDRRGIDVGLIYLEDIFKPILERSIPVLIEDQSDFRTRDILYVKGTLGNDSLHLFINHWPSRYGGTLETDELRVSAANALKSVTDSICSVQPDAAILILGDFNDNPSNKSLSVLLDTTVCTLKQLPHRIKNNQVRGTLKYQGKWALFDQVMASEVMSGRSSGLGLVDSVCQVFCPDFLLEDDKRYLGVKPFRTYQGFKYLGGFSDHLPIFVDIYNTYPE